MPSSGELISVYWYQVIQIAALTAISALGLNLIYGFNGQFSLGHMGFYAIGAYGSALITKDFTEPSGAAPRSARSPGSSPARSASCWSLLLIHAPAAHRRAAQARAALAERSTQAPHEAATISTLVVAGYHGCWSSGRRCWPRLGLARGHLRGC